MVRWLDGFMAIENRSCGRMKMLSWEVCGKELNPHF